jgi:hypothetical protein
MLGTAVIGGIVMVAIMSYGVYKLYEFFTNENMVPRYRYEKTVDENGNEITKVVDLRDPEYKEILEKE